jgi:hypothetical protein
MGRLAVPWLSEWRIITDEQPVMFGNGSRRKWGFLLAPRSRAVEQTNPTPLQSVPQIPSGIQDHSFHAQAMFDINKQVGKLEICLDHVEQRLEKVETQLSTLSSDVSLMRTQIDTLIPIAKSALNLLKWAIGILATFGLSILGMWIKHYFGW